MASGTFPETTLTQHPVYTNRNPPSKINQLLQGPVIRLREPAVVRAAREGDLVTVLRLLDEDPQAANARGWMGETPLHAAASGGSPATVRLLIEAGAQPRARRDNGDTPLHRAMTGEIAELLIRAAREATPDQHNEHQQTPLHTARDGEVAAVLLRYGASLTARDFEGGTPLHDTNAAKARVLLDAGADVHVCDESGRTPLHQAVWHCDVDLVELLLAAGADPAVRDLGGTSPVRLAQSRGPQPIRALLDAAMEASGQPLAEPANSTTVTGHGQHELRVDSDGRAAFSVTRHATLVRWRLDEPPRPDAVVATEHIGIRDLAVHPRRPLVAVAPEGAPLELRHRDDLTGADVLTSLVAVTALAFSPDGRRLAAATRDERVVLLDLGTREVTAEVEGGERTCCLAFSPNGSLLASACSFQGGAHVRLDRVTADGRLEPSNSVDRADCDTPSQRFVDTIPAIVFTPDGRGLVIWETSAIYHQQRPAGWRGDVVMADTAIGQAIWERSIDAETTGLRTPLAVAGSPMGYFTTPCLAMGGAAIAVGVDGAVVLLTAADGATHAVVPISGKANAVCTDRATGTLVIATDQGLRQVQLSDNPSLS